MKIKLLSFAVLSSILLSACGGGSSSSSTNPTNPTTADQQWTSYDISTAEIAPNQQQHVIDKEVVTLKNGKTYLKESTTFPSQVSDYLMITVSGIYDDVNAPVDPTLGRLIGQTKMQTNQWEFKPYSSIGSTDLTLTTQYKTLDLSGKLLLQYLAPVDYLIISKNFKKLHTINDDSLAFYKTFATATFPTGSSCIQAQIAKNNAEYLELNADLKDTDEQQSYKSEWNDYRVDKTSILKNLKDTTAYLQQEEDEISGYALYKNQYYAAYFTPKGSELNVSDLKKSLDNIYKDHKDTAELLKTALDNTCSYYNPTAAKSISTAIKF